MTSSPHVYEIRPRKDKRGFDLISDALPFGGLWYGGPDPGLRFGGQQLAKMCFGRWLGSFKPAILAMPYKWVRMQDERYSADSPKQPKLCEAGNVIDKE